jgi:two-component system sensor histidine kinase KdpD
MLQVARELVLEQGRDLAVGVVETHRRKETAELLLGLELLPRRTTDHRGHLLDEFDLDRALARRPSCLLVDELAHENAPGSRHRKRWQDVQELLEAGIDVLTTLNIQHVESLNDVITQITGVRVRETVPDAILDQADTVELVDITAEELLRRLQEGKVYLPEQAQRAAEHFFRRGNLLALRELALRRTAQRVDADMQAYRQQHGVAATWPAGERVLVCVGPAPSSGRLVRAAARMAAGLRCPWIAAYVEPPGAALPSQADQQRLDEHLRVAESLGATVARLSGERVADALLAHARRHNVTRIVIGKPTHSPLRDRLRGSLLDELVRGSEGMDVLVIRGDDLPEPSSRASPRPSRSRLSRHLAAASLVALTLGVALLLRTLLDVPDPEMLFLLAVVVASVRLGRGPALLAAALGVACYDFFFVPPFHTFSVEDRRYFLTFTVMFGVGYTISELASRLRRQERSATSREARTSVLYALTRELASALSSPEIARSAARQAAEVFRARAVVLLTDPSGALTPGGASPEDASLGPAELGVARWSFEHGKPAGLGTDTLPGATCLVVPLLSGEARPGVLALFPPDGAPLPGEQRDFLDVFCRQVASAFERALLAEEARSAALRARTEEMRATLLSTVSHDLRTPLAAITGSATTLRDGAHLEPQTREDLLDSICDQAERLERLVANLLDMTRLTSGGLSLRRDWVPLDEIIGSSLTHLERSLSSRRVEVALPGDLPLLFVDPVLCGQLFVNLIENAHKYTPATEPIEIQARQEGDLVLVDVLDHGAGIPEGTEEKVFEKFFRGPHKGISGAGLGLPICRSIAEAHGGRIQASNRREGGALFRVTLPLAPNPPALPGAEAPP